MGHRYDTMRAAAFRKKGEDWRNLIVAWEITRMVAPWAFVALALGGLGWAARAAWFAVTDTPDTVDATLPVAAASVVGAVPGWLWIAGAVVVAVVAWLFRPGRVLIERERRFRIVMVGAAVIVMAGLIGLGMGSVTGVG